MNSYTKKELEEDRTGAQAEMLANRLRKRFQHLKKWAKRIDAGAFRLYDRDIPEIPLLIDYYGNVSDPASAAIACSLYERPYEKDAAEELRWLLAMEAAASSALGLAPQNVFFRLRKRQRGLAQYERLPDRGAWRVVQEAGLRYRVNLSDYLDTGLFLDRRLLRSQVRASSTGMRMLNLFAYTGAFTINAASGGAAHTDSVDISNTYLEWAAENLKQNGFDVGGRNTLIRADVREFLFEAAKKGQRWDRIVLDPPAFSNSKKMHGELDLQRDCSALIGRCLAVLAPGGLLWFCANPRSFKIDAPRLQALLAEHPPQSLATVSDISAALVDEDFKGRKLPVTFAITQVR